MSRRLKVLLSGYGLANLDPGRNGLGLNNILYISMSHHYFEYRVAEQKTAGQLLLVEEPEATCTPISTCAVKLCSLPNGCHLPRSASS
jgi:putative ATP-dependent endonuclease of OLD family